MTRFPWPATPPRTWLDLVDTYATVSPSVDLLVAAPDGVDIVDRRTYPAIARRARAIATALQAVAAPGSRVLCLFRDRLAFVDALFGCLYAGMVAVPTYPPRPGRNGSDGRRERAAAILADCTPGVVLADEASAKGAAAIAESGLVVLVADEAHVPSHLADDWTAPAIGPDTIAVLQYTSGSTSAPRGVVLTHRHLLANSEAILRAFGHSSSSRGVLWLPHEHDMGLVGAILQPVYASLPTMLMSPLHFVQEPARWLRAISSFGATTAGGPNFSYQMCVDRVDDEDLTGVDLSSWEVAFVGAEPVQAATLAAFARRFAAVGFRPQAFLPCYGLAEATLIVTGGPKGEGSRSKRIDRVELGRRMVRPAEGDGAVELVACGAPALCDVRVVRTGTTTPVDAGEVGEVLVSGDSVAAGYWGRSGEPGFAETLAGAGGRFLRTGDLGFLEDGQLFVAGRLKDVIIVDGANCHPEDIERSLDGLHPDLRSGGGACFGVDRNGSEAVVVVWELRRERAAADRARIAGQVRTEVARGHAVPLADVVLTPPGRIPRTGSGKVQRFECRRRYMEGEFDDSRCTLGDGDGDTADDARACAGA